MLVPALGLLLALTLAPASGFAVTTVLLGSLKVKP
jgi:hypothetical protein